MTQPLPNPIAGYDDWHEFMLIRGVFAGSDGDSAALADVLGVPAPLPEHPVDTVDRLEVGETVVTRLEWSTGFGPRTGAWLVRPRDRDDKVLPGILGLHCHGGFKWRGAEQLVDLGERNPPELRALVEAWYSGRYPASELAARGFAVLVHDAFSWGSRRFPLEERSAKLAGAVAAQEALWERAGVQPTDAERYNAAAGAHEDTLAKAAGVLGTSYAGTIAHDDLVALDVLAGLDGVDGTRLGAFGFSGGGGRAVLLSALSNRVRASVVSCMMATFESLTPRYLDVHSWLLNSPGLWRYSEWPDLVRPGAVLVQYGERDALFPPEGMRAAHDRLAAVAGYRGSFFDAGHVFDAAMQREATDFFEEHLRR